MRYTSPLLLAIALMVAYAGSCRAESLQITTTPVSNQVKRGVPMVVKANLENILAPRDPVTITAEAEWEDEYGTIRTAAASTTIVIVQPVKLNRYKVIVPALFAFVAGSAKIDGQPVTPVLEADRLTFELGLTLLEGESVVLEYSMKAQ